MSEYMTLSKAAPILGVSHDTIRQYVLSGKLPAIQLPSGHYRVRRSDVEQLLKPAPVFQPPRRPVIDADTARALARFGAT